MHGCPEIRFPKDIQEGRRDWKNAALMLSSSLHSLERPSSRKKMVPSNPQKQKKRGKKKKSACGLRSKPLGPLKKGVILGRNIAIFSKGEKTLRSPGHWGVNAPQGFEKKKLRPIG